MKHRAYLGPNDCTLHVAQVELVWALPWSASADVLPSPVVAVMSAPVLQAHSNPSPGSNGDSSSDPWQSCAAGARPMADLECGPSAGGAVCPSNQCCGPLPRDLAVAIGLEAFIGNRSFFNVCDESEYICTVGWAEQILVQWVGARAYCCCARETPSPPFG